jgi:hypothetical protein
VAEAESILLGFFQSDDCVFSEKFADQLLWTVNTSLPENSRSHSSDFSGQVVHFPARRLDSTKR